MRRLDQYRFGGRDGRGGGGGTDVGKRLRFCLRDLGLRHLGPAGDEFLDLGLGIHGHALGFTAGVGDDRLGYLFGLALLAPIFGQYPFGFLAQFEGVVELGLDTGAAIVERLEQQVRHPEPNQDNSEDHKRDRDPGFRCVNEIDHRGPLQRLMAASTAAAATAIDGAFPVRRATMAMVASCAMLCTFAMAAVLVAAIVCSAAATLAWSVASADLRLASASALTLSRVSAAIANARARALANSLS